jgi:L-threonylcarbamoyladenylate synthase
MAIQTETIHALSADAACRVVEVLARGGLVALPTDTVYGLAALPQNREAVLRLYEAKNRPHNNPVPLLLSDRDGFERVGTVPEGFALAFRRLTGRFWPGGLTLVVPKTEFVLEEVSHGPTVAVRVPDLTLARELIGAAGGVLAVTSANISGQLNPVTAREVKDQLGGRIELIVDGGTCRGGVPSTVLDCTALPPRVLRFGIIPEEALRSVIDSNCTCAERQAFS